MSLETASVLGFLGTIYFLYWWGQKLRTDAIWGVILKYLTTTVTIGLFLPVLSYVVQLNNANPTLLAATQTFYTVFFWVFLTFIVFLSISFAFEVIGLIGGKRNGQD